MKPQTKTTSILQTGLYFSITILIGLFLSARGAMLPNLANQVGVGLGQIGIIITASSVGFTTTNLFFGRIYDRFRGHWLILFALAMIGVVIAMMPFANQLGWMILLFFLTGLFRGIIILGTNTLPLWLYGDKSAPVMNALQGFFGAGGFIGPIVVAQVLNLSGQTNWVYWACALGYLLLVPAAIFIPSPTIQKAPVKNPKSAAAHTINENYQIIFLLALFLVFYVGTEVSFGSWVTTYAKTQLAPDQAFRAFELASTFWITIMAGRFLSAFLSARIGTEKLLGINLIGMIGSLVLILLAGGNLFFLFAGTALLGLSMASTFPLVFALAEEIMDVTSRITSFLFVGASIGSIIFPMLMGKLIASANPTMTIVSLLIMMIIATVIFAILYLAIRRNKTKHRG